MTMTPRQIAEIHEAASLSQDWYRREAFDRFVNENPEYEFTRKLEAGKNLKGVSYVDQQLLMFLALQDALELLGKCK
jgi:hypothetical protein